MNKWEKFAKSWWPRVVFYLTSWWFHNIKTQTSNQIRIVSRIEYDHVFHDPTRIVYLSGIRWPRVRIICWIVSTTTGSNSIILGEHWGSGRGRRAISYGFSQNWRLRWMNRFQQTNCCRGVSSETIVGMIGVTGSAVLHENLSDSTGTSTDQKIGQAGTREKTEKRSKESQVKMNKTRLTP